MSTKFKTNIKCSGCIAKVSKTLNDMVGEDKWSINTENPNKFLTLTNSNIQKEELIKAIKNIGFNIEELKNA